MSESWTTPCMPGAWIERCTRWIWRAAVCAGRRDSPGIIVGGVLLSGDTLFVASSRPEGQVQALGISKGKRIWRVSVDPVGAPLAMIGGLVIAETQRGEVLALEPGSGKIHWRRRVGTARGAAIPAGNGALLVSTTDSLFRLSIADGRVTHRTASPGTVIASWLPYRGSLVGGTTDSQVVSIDPADLRRNWVLSVDAPVLNSPPQLPTRCSSRRGSARYTASIPKPSPRPDELPGSTGRSLHR